MRKPGGKNANKMLNRWQQVSLIAQENLELAVFLFYHRWRYAFNCKVKNMQEDTVYLLAGQNRLKDYYKDPDILPNVNKVNMAGIMEAIKEYLISIHNVVT